MKARFVIINTTDAPEPNNVAEWIEGIGYCYMVRKGKGHRHKKGFDGMQPNRETTPVDAFGIAVCVRENDAVFSTVVLSAAIYLDGKPRRWQGLDDFCLLLVTDAKKRKEPKC